MADDNGSSDVPANSRPRRGSITSNTFTALFGRSNSTSNPNSVTAPQPGPVATATAPGRRMSISTLGLSGTSPMQASPFGFSGGRRASVSTAGSDSIDESAIEDDDGPGPARSQPTTPFARRMSFGAQALLTSRTNGSPGTAAEGLNWSEQFRSRAESAVQRPSFSTSPSSTMPRSPAAPSHERAKSISDMPAPPTASIPPPVLQREQSALRRKPDAVGERILRGDFYMD